MSTTSNSFGAEIRAMFADALKDAMANSKAPRQATANAQLPANLDLDAYLTQAETRGDALTSGFVQSAWGLLGLLSTRKPAVKIPASVNDRTLSNLFVYLDAIDSRDITLETRAMWLETLKPFVSGVLSMLISAVTEKSAPTVIVVQSPGAMQGPVDTSYLASPGPGNTLARPRVSLVSALRG